MTSVNVMSSSLAVCLSTVSLLGSCSEPNSKPVILIILCKCFLTNQILFFTQDEEQDPLLNSFGNLKDILNTIKGTWPYLGCEFHFKC